MRTLHPTAQIIFNRLVLDLPEGETRKFDKRPGTYMAVHVEHLSPGLYSITHYFESNGDLVADPDMTFYRASDGVVALTIQHSSGHYTEAARVNGGRVEVVNDRELGEVTDVATEVRGSHFHRFHRYPGSHSVVPRRSGALRHCRETGVARRAGIVMVPPRVRAKVYWADFWIR